MIPHLVRDGLTQAGADRGLDNLKGTGEALACDPLTDVRPCAGQGGAERGSAGRAGALQLARRAAHLWCCPGAVARRVRPAAPLGAAQGFAPRGWRVFQDPRDQQGPASPAQRQR